MSYRDELDAAHARAAKLQRELDDARRELDELRDKRSRALVLAQPRDVAVADGEAKPTTVTKLFGGPTRLELVRELEGEVPATVYPDLIACIRERLSEVGHATTMEGSLTWTGAAHHKSTGPFVEVMVTSRRGKTTIRVHDRLGNLFGAIYGGVGGGVGGGGIIAPILVTTAMPVLAPVAFLGWFGGIYALCRGIYKRQATKRARTLQALIEELEELAREALEPATGTPRP